MNHRATRTVGVFVDYFVFPSYDVAFGVCSVIFGSGHPKISEFVSVCDLTRFDDRMILTKSNQITDYYITLDSCFC